MSIALQPEYYREIFDNQSFNFIPFARWDSMDDERTHYDIRELSFMEVAEKFELRAGIKKVFWGVTESVHLVDIINQTDGVESLDGEEKLGQPMVNLSVPRNWGTIDMFVLPYFRERTFPGEDGRLRTVLPVDREKAQYESDDKQRHIDYALRYIHTIDNSDARMVSLEASRRITGNWKVNLEGYLFLNQTAKELLYGLRNDEYLQLELVRYF